MKNEIEEFNAKRMYLNSLMNDSDDFFELFGKLDDMVYSEGEIPKKYKELTGLSISILTRCEECTAYHLQNCIKEQCSKAEIIEAIKMGVIGGGSIVYPTVRFAYKLMKDLGM